ncbi:hypothetical protein [Dyella acidiphila]|uniref:DUF4169 family protein n=1 Tax=Dyella acidiphila TaxID=2775866 RepID=A0ABR9GCQ7_9GAMM|nr:hypothetical protein [Dyella acidiphila]MBE1161819.1 hypothetical protein [Dyella acidiphila]
MTLRNEAVERRRRKNVKFEQERVASLDSDLQRAGGIKSPPKNEDKPKPAKKSTH